MSIRDVYRLPIEPHPTGTLVERIAASFVNGVLFAPDTLSSPEALAYRILYLEFEEAEKRDELWVAPCGCRVTYDSVTVKITRETETNKLSYAFAFEHDRERCSHAHTEDALTLLTYNIDLLQLRGVLAGADDLPKAPK